MVHATILEAISHLVDFRKQEGAALEKKFREKIANINSSTGAVELEAATASDVKKSTSVYVYGETQDDGEIHATKVLITRFN